MAICKYCGNKERNSNNKLTYTSKPKPKTITTRKISHPFDSKVNRLFCDLEKEEEKQTYAHTHIHLSLHTHYMPKIISIYRTMKMDEQKNLAVTSHFHFSEGKGKKSINMDQFRFLSTNIIGMKKHEPNFLFLLFFNAN